MKVAETSDGSRNQRREQKPVMVAEINSSGRNQSSTQTFADEEGRDSSHIFNDEFILGFSEKHIKFVTS